MQTIVAEQLEYKIVRGYLFMSEAEMNELGREGWRLACVYVNADQVVSVFARPAVE